MTEIDQGPPPAPASDPGQPPQPPQPQPQAPPPAPDPAAFDPDAYDRDQLAQVAGARKAVLASSMAGASENDPDRASKVLAIGDKLGLDSKTVEANYDELNARVRLQNTDWDHVLSNHPEVAKWLSIPDNAAIAQDEVPQLTELDRSFQRIAGRDITGILPPGFLFQEGGQVRGPLHEDGTPPVVYKNIDAVRAYLDRQASFDRVDQEQAQAMQDQLTRAHWFPALSGAIESSLARTVGAGISTLNTLDRATGGTGPFTFAGMTGGELAGGADQLAAASERLSPGLRGTLTRTLGQLVGDAPLYLAGGEIAGFADVGKALGTLRAATALPRVPTSSYLADVWKTALAYAPMGIRSGINTGSQQGPVYGTLDALINTLGPASMGSRLGLARALIPGQAPESAEGGFAGMAGRLLLHAGSQGGAMGATELANALHEYASGANPGALKADQLLPRLAQAGVMGAALSTAFHLPGEIGHVILGRQIQANGAMEHADSLATAMEQASALEAPERSPSRWQELLKQAFPDGARTVHYQAEDWADAAKAAGMKPEDMAAKMKVEEEWRIAQATGKPMQVPTDQLIGFGSSLEDPKAKAALAMGARRAPLAMSGGEALKFYDDTPDQMGTQLKGMQDDIKKMAAELPETDSIYQDLLAKAVDAGEPLEAARQPAKANAAFFHVLAERESEPGGKQIDPVEAYQRYGLRVRSGEPGVQVEPLDMLINRLRHGDVPTDEQVHGKSLVPFLRGIGMADEGGELAKFEVDKQRKPGEHNLIDKTDGVHQDEAASAAHEAGYLRTEDPAELLAAIQAELAGKPHFAEGAEDPVHGPIRAALEELRQQIHERGMSLERSNAEIKAALAGEEGPAVKSFQQAIGRIAPRGESLGREEMLRQYRKAIGDRTPVEGGAEWMKLQRDSARIDAQRRAATLTVGGRRVVAADVPYGAGSSKDGKTVYVDRRIPRWAIIDGKKIDVWEAVAQHEIAEKAQLDQGKSYAESHITGTHADDADIDHQGIKHADYEAFLKPYLAAAKREARPNRVPSDLEDRPYKEMGEEHLLAGKSVRYEQAAFHGTGNVEPYERFDMSKVGGAGGEGAQAYGHGLYFSSRREVGEAYRRQNSSPFSNEALRAYFAPGRVIPGYSEFEKVSAFHLNDQGQWYVTVKASDQQGNILKSVGGLPNRERNHSTMPERATMIAFLKEHHPELLNKGRLYHVDVPEDNELLNREVPFNKQPEGVQEKLLSSGLIQKMDNGRIKLPNGEQIFPEHLDGATLYDAIAEGKLTPEAGSEALRQAGIPGMTYLGREGGAKNYVIFDDKRINIQRYEQGGEGEARGSIEFNAERHFTITRGGNADLSTLLHELGHFWLEVMGDFSEREGATDRLKGDYQKVMDFLGAKDRASLQTEHHEKFARAIEQYFMEGHAPSPELRGVFARFAIWLTHIYKHLGSLVNLTPEVKGVFDRLFATDAAIDRANQDLGTSTIFTDQAASGMKDDEWKSYLNDIRRGREQIQARVYSKAAEVQRAQATQVYNRNKLRARFDATRIIDRRPAYIAERALVHGEDEHGQPTDAKLSRQDIEAQFGPDAASHMIRGITTTEPTGLSLRTAAEAYHFSGPDELFTALAKANFKKRHVAIAELADGMLKAKYPETSAEGMLNEAMQAVHDNSAHADVLSRESAAIAIKAGQRAIPLKAMRAAAERQLEATNHRDINPDSWLRAEQQASRRAAAAFTAKEPNYTEALLHKQREEFSHQMYRAAQEAKETIGKTEDMVKQSAKLSMRQRLGKSDTYVVTAESGQWAVFGSHEKAVEFAGTVKGTVDTALSSVDQMRQLWESDLKNDLDYGAVKDFHDQLASVTYQARQASRLIAEGKKAELDAAISEGMQTQDTATGGKLKGGSASPILKGMPHRLIHAISGFDCFNRTMSSLTREMDGEKPGGWHWDHFNRPLNHAADEETGLRVEMNAERLRLGKEWGKNGRLHEKVFVPAVSQHLSLENRLAVLLNAGSTLNKERLMRNPGWNQEQLDAVIGTLDEKDIAFAKGLWNLAGNYKQRIFALKAKLDGIPPVERDAIPVRTKFGTIDGGYYPIGYDPEAGARAIEVSMDNPGNPLMGKPRAGFTESALKTTGMRPLLELSVLDRHLDHVAHFLSHGEAISNANKILARPDFRQSTIDHFGDNAFKALTDRVKTVAQGSGEIKNGIERGLAWVRRKTGLATMGYNLSTAIAHGFGITQSMHEVGAGPYLNAMARLSASAVNGENLLQFIDSKSDFMRNQHLTFAPESAERLRMGSGGRVIDAVTAHSYILMHQMLRRINAPTWLAVYDREMARPEQDEGRAVDLANQAVKDTQGSGLAVDLTSAQDRNEYWKTLMQFSSFFTRTYQQARPSVVAALTQRDPAAMMKLAHSFLMLVTVPVVAADIFHQTVQKPSPGEHSAGWWAERLGRDHLAYMLSTFAVGREFAGTAEGYDYNGPAGMRSFNMLNSLLKVGASELEGHHHEAQLARSAMQVGLAAFGLPAVQIDHLIQGFLYDQREGSINPAPVLFGPPPRR